MLVAGPSLACRSLRVEAAWPPPAREVLDDDAVEVCQSTMKHPELANDDLVRLASELPADNKARLLKLLAGESDVVHLDDERAS